MVDAAKQYHALGLSVIPVGKDKPESLRLFFDGLTSNEEIKVVFNVKEGR